MDTPIFKDLHPSNEQHLDDLRESEIGASEGARPSYTELPKLIHHTWKHTHLHPLLRRCVDSFRKWNPGWKCEFWTDDACERLIADELPDFLETYQGYPAGILRADVFRLAVLYLRGGVYADLDMECLRPLDELIEASQCRSGDWEVLLGRDHPSHERLHYKGRQMWLNAFMLARPGARYLRLVLDELTRRWQSGNYDVADAVMSTGPGLLTRVIELGGGNPRAMGIAEAPWQWVHPLPNVYLQFPERPAYKRLVRRRSWREGLQLDFASDGIARNGWVRGEPPYVAHYWWHSYIKNCRQINMLASFGPLLLQSDGEIVERRLCTLDSEACPQSLGEALCILAERSGRRILLTGTALPGHVSETLEQAGAGLDWQMVNEEALAQVEAPVDLWVDHVTGESYPGRHATGVPAVLAPGGLHLRLQEGRDVKVSASPLPPGLRPLSQNFALFEACPGPEQEIPKTLHWLPWGDLNPWQRDAARSWRAANSAPDWQWRPWTLEELEKLVAETEPDLLATYFDYPTDAYRVMAARWVVLKHVGGLIIPPGGVCLRPLMDFIRWKRLMFSTNLLPGGCREVNDEFLGSVAGHPFWNGLAAHLETNRFMPLDEAAGGGFLQQRCRAAACLLGKPDWPELHGEDVLSVSLSGREWPRLVRSRNWLALSQLVPDAWTLSMKGCFEPVELDSV
jgi:mannosyltransferase OCH1-like enzyme